MVSVDQSQSDEFNPCRRAVTEFFTDLQNAEIGGRDAFVKKSLALRTALGIPEWANSEEMEILALSAARYCDEMTQSVTNGTITPDKIISDPTAYQGTLARFNEILDVLGSQLTDEDRENALKFPSLARQFNFTPGSDSSLDLPPGVTLREFITQANEECRRREIKSIFHKKFADGLEQRCDETQRKYLTPAIIEHALTYLESNGTQHLIGDHRSKGTKPWWCHTAGNAVLHLRQEGSHLAFIVLAPKNSETFLKSHGNDTYK